MKRSAFFLFALILFTGCVQTAQTVDQYPTRVQSVNGSVQSVANNKVTFLLSLPDFKKAADTPAAEIARQIVEKGLFVEGLAVNIQGVAGEITNVAGNSVTVLFSKPAAYSTGQAVQLEIPRKRIAVVDFTVIKGSMKEAGPILMEQVSSSLIESKHFTVVERAKLSAIMEEMKLLQSGLAEEIPRDLRPKLMFADLMLTGTLAELGDKYDINMRLLNVRTGQAIAAINLASPLYKPSEIRDTSAWNEDFEGVAQDHTWAMGTRQKGNVAFVLDDTTGAIGSKRSFRLDYFFDLSKKGKFCNALRNNKKRDLSLYEGVEFYVKGAYPVTGYINIDISDRDDGNARTRWFAQFPVTPSWQLVRIPFSQLSYLKAQQLDREGYKPGKQVRDMTHVEAFLVGTCNNFVNEESKKGSIWIDNVRFYK